MAEKEMQSMNIVVAGHVDHGKSTIIGRMLADTDSLPDGRLAQVKETCRRNAKPFEYAFLLDALKDEQSQGITIDSARCFFKTKKREYIIIDAPGHIEFLKNMVTGAARAEAAILVIDANEGVQENSKRHGYLLSMLGITQIAVVVNKMDLVNYEEAVFNEIKNAYAEFLKDINVEAESFIPVSGFNGENIANRSLRMPWYDGGTVLEQLDLFNVRTENQYSAFRMPVQDVYKFTEGGDDRRIIAGTIDAGSISIGEQIVFYPSGKSTKVKSIEVFNKNECKCLNAGYACSFTMTDQIYITRGEVAAKQGERPPYVAKKLKTKIFWLGKKPFKKNKKYFIKIGTVKTSFQLLQINKIIEASTLEAFEGHFIEKNQVAECVLKFDKPIACDIIGENENTCRFVIVDDYEISGGGIITEILNDETKWVRDKVITKNIKWEHSNITIEERANKYGQEPKLIMFMGGDSIKRKEKAKMLERKFFESGKFVYYLGMANILYGIDADIKVENSLNNKEEQIRRMAELAYVMLNAGLIVIVTADDMEENDKKIITEVITENIIEWRNLR